MADRLTFGGVEGGGTKFVCVAGSGPDDIVASTTIADPWARGAQSGVLGALVLAGAR